MRNIPKEIRWLLRQAKPFKEIYLVRLLTVVVASLVALVDPLILKWLIDEVLPWGREGMLWLVAAAFFAAFFFKFGFNYLGLLLDTYAGERVKLAIRRKLLGHLQKLSPAYHVTTSSGDSLHRLERDVERISELGGHTLASLLRITIMTSLTVGILFLLNWRLTLFVLPLVPIMLLLRRFSYPHLKKLSDKVQEAESDRVTFLQDHLPALPQVQLLNRTAGERHRFFRLARKVMGQRVRRRGVELLLMLSTHMTHITATAIVLGYGGHQVIQETLTIGGLVAFYTYLSRIFGPLQTTVQLYSGLQRSSASIRRVMEVLDVEPTLVDPETPRALPQPGPLGATLEGVSFGYGDDDDRNAVLQDLDLTIHPGEKVALVGASGGGKSTLARLLVRMYDPDRGSVSLTDIDVRDLKLRTLRDQVALVPQDPVLFDVSLERNLRFARSEASREDLERVIDRAQLRDAVAEMPDGMSTPLGSRGKTLSGGQRQRVALARAMLQEPRLLILDEATSALDGPTEQKILEALDERLTECTVLLIAHRLSAILWTDRIVVLDGGRVVADGRHRDLYSESSVYRELCDEQLKTDDLSLGPIRLVPTDASKEAAAP